MDITTNYPDLIPPAKRPCLSHDHVEPLCERTNFEPAPTFSPEAKLQSLASAVFQLTTDGSQVALHNGTINSPVKSPGSPCRHPSPTKSRPHQLVRDEDSSAKRSLIGQIEQVVPPIPVESPPSDTLSTTSSSSSSPSLDGDVPAAAPKKKPVMPAWWPSILKRGSGLWHRLGGIEGRDPKIKRPTTLAPLQAAFAKRPVRTDVVAQAQTTTHGHSPAQSQLAKSAIPKIVVTESTPSQSATPKRAPSEKVASKSGSSKGHTFKAPEAKVKKRKADQISQKKPAKAEKAVSKPTPVAPARSSAFQRTGGHCSQQNAFVPNAGAIHRDTIQLPRANPSAKQPVTLVNVQSSMQIQNQSVQQQFEWWTKVRAEAWMKICEVYSRNPAALVDIRTTLSTTEWLNQLIAQKQLRQTQLTEQSNTRSLTNEEHVELQTNLMELQSLHAIRDAHFKALCDQHPEIALSIQQYRSALVAFTRIGT